jgi:hypothetical protein
MPIPGTSKEMKNHPFFDVEWFAEMVVSSFFLPFQSDPAG